MTTNHDNEFGSLVEIFFNIFNIINVNLLAAVCYAHEITMFS